MAARKRLNKREVEQILRMQDRLCALKEKYDEEKGTDIPLQIESNGTVGGNIDCAIASLEVILQEYI